MYVLNYLYNKLFTVNNKIEIDTKIHFEDIKKKELIKNDICNNICDMNIITKDDMANIKNMSHSSLLYLIGLLSNVNNNIIVLLNDDDYMISNEGTEKEKIDEIMYTKKS